MTRLRRGACVMVALGLALPARAARPEQDQVTDLVERLVLAGDTADPELVRTLAAQRSPEALAGLLRVWEAMHSVYLRREVLRGLALYDDVPGAEHEAMAHLMDVATGATERELRMTAIAVLGDSRTAGLPYLRRIVDSPADDEVREGALAIYLEAADVTAAELAWIRGIYQPAAPEPEERGRGRARETAPEVVPVDYTAKMRLLAFRALAPGFAQDALLAATRHPEREIRASALENLAASGFPQSTDLALAVFKDVREWPANRLVAATILARGADDARALELFEVAGRRDASDSLALGVGALLGKQEYPKLLPVLLRTLSKGKGRECLAAVPAVERSAGPDVDKRLIRLVDHEDVAIRRQAVTVLGARRSEAAVPELEKLVRKAVDPDDAVAALHAIGAIRKHDADWPAELVAWTKDERDLVRSAAIDLLAEKPDPRQEPLFAELLGNPDWNTRLAAALALERLRTRSAVATLVARMSIETGRLRVDLGAILWRLTGQPFGAHAERWTDWLAREGATFELRTAAEIAELRQEEEDRRLRQVTTAQTFFGIAIESENVLFVIDISGSMEAIVGSTDGGSGRSRLDVARSELARCIESLPAGSRFNILVFSERPQLWEDEMRARTDESLGDARAFLKKLRPEAGTSMHAALSLAFSYGQADSIYLLSDGEPTDAEPETIRRHVSEWNQHRRVVIHCVAIGGSLPTLAWLAADSGGKLVQYR